MLKIKAKLLLVITLLLASLGVMIALKIKQPTYNPEAFHGTLLNQPRVLEPFNLTGIDDKPFDNTKLQGQWTIFFFGFTHCGGVCPTTMGELAKMVRLLEQQNISPKPKVVMITIDPKRDSIETLRQYVQTFNPQFYGARGTSKATRELSKALGVAYTKVVRSSSANQDYNDIEHTGALMFFNPKGKLVAFTTPPHQAQMLAEDYQLLTHLN